MKNRIYLISNLVIASVIFVSCSGGGGGGSDAKSPATPALENQTPGDGGNSSEKNTDQPVSQIPAIETPLNMRIENSYVMGTPVYLLAQKFGNSYSVYFVRELSDDRIYALCEQSGSELGRKETVGVLSLPVTAGTVTIPSTNASARVFLTNSLTYVGFKGSIQVDSIANGMINGSLNLNTTSEKGKSEWTGSFSALICAQEKSFFDSKSIQMDHKVVELKDKSTTQPGTLTILAADNTFGSGGSLKIRFSPDKVAGKDYYPDGFHFETEVRLLGGKMINQKDKIVGEYSNTKLVYSTKGGALSSIVDEFEFEIDYSDKANVKMEFITTKTRYSVLRNN